MATAMHGTLVKMLYKQEEIETLKVAIFNFIHLMGMPED